jgi:hypothetical protein
MNRILLMLVAALAGTIFGGACQSQAVGEMQRDSQKIQPKNAQTVRAHLKMGAGELNVTGGLTR